MAGDRLVFQDSMDKWQEMKRQAAYCAPEDEACVAILLSYFRGSSFDEYEHEKRIHELVNEALAINHRERSRGRNTEIIYDARRADFDEVLSDEHFDKVIVIGNGCLASLDMSGNDGFIDRYSWFSVSRSVTNLKRGIEQRFCGSFSREINVPFGMFAVDSLRNLRAPFGQYVEGSRNMEYAIQSAGVIGADTLDYDDIKRLFPKGGHGSEDSYDAMRDVMILE